MVLKFAQNFSLLLHKKHKKTHRCTFATDAGRRLRTTRTSLDVDISSVRRPFSSILLLRAAKVFFVSRLSFCRRFVVLSSSSSSSSYAYFILNRDAFYFTNNR